MIEWTFMVVIGLNALSGVIFYFVALHGLFGVVSIYFIDPLSHATPTEAVETAKGHWEAHIVFANYMGAGSLFLAIAAFVYRFGVGPN